MAHEKKDNINGKYFRKTSCALHGVAMVLVIWVGRERAHIVESTNRLTILQRTDDIIQWLALTGPVLNID